MIKSTNLYLISFCILFICFSNVLFAQVDRTFWFAVPKETSGHGCIGTDNFPHGGSAPNYCLFNTVSFKVTAMSLDAHVTVSMPANPSFIPHTFTVRAGQTYVDELANSWATFGTVYNNTAAYNSVPVTGKTDRGFLITSDNDITVYYDYDNYYNRDLFSLKGSNSLGTDFYTPFQNIWYNDTTYSPNPYSSFDIVATENNTIVTITPRSGQSFEGRPNDAMWSVTLNKGEGYSVRAKYASARAHMPGVHITSTKKIAVTINDDSPRQVGPSCRDINGDQLVPTNIIGSKYLVMTGDRSNALGSALTSPYHYTNGVGEQIFVTSASPNTKIRFIGKDGTLLYQTAALAAGESDYFSVDINNVNMSSIYITSNSPANKFYVYHITGIGCELGGAILPPITDCTGSNEVNFYRSGTVDDITVNLMIPYDRNKAFTDTSQSHYHFKLITYDASGNITSTYAIPGTWFEPNDSAGWAVLKSTTTERRRNFNSITTKGMAHKVLNTRDFFHLGMTNGTANQTNKYGYFSSFNVSKAEVRVSSTETQDYIGCFGQPITLVAKGGLAYTWHYGSPSGPPTYLDDPKSANPSIINCPSGSHNFYVEVVQSKCFGTDTLKVNVIILPQTTARFDVDKSTICAIDTVRFTNTSQQAQNYSWTKQIDNNPPIAFSPSNNLNFYEVLDNPSLTVSRVIRYKLYAEHNQGCNDTISKIIKVYPKIHAEFTPTNSSVCDSSLINFKIDTNRSYGISLYTWDFGDQGSSSVDNPSHVFRNITPTDTTYKVNLIVKSNFFCTDTAKGTVTTHPFVRAGFTVDTIKGCSPFVVRLYNNSMNRKAIGKYFWDFNYHAAPVLPRDTVTVFSNKDTIYHTFPRNTTPNPIDYTISLKVYDIYGNDCSPAVYRTITVYPEAAIRILKNDTAICHNQTIAFNKTLCDPAVNTFVWNFGDGGTSPAKFPSHTFTNFTQKDTIYRVLLQGMSPAFCNGSDTMYVTVHAKINPLFSIDAPSNCAPFNASITNATTGGVTKYEWFETNKSTNQLDTIVPTGYPVFQHTFHNATNDTVIHAVKLRISNSGGCRDSITRTIVVYPEIQVDFVPDALFGCNPLTVNFKGQYNPAVASTIFWEFGDGTSSFLPSPTHVFTHTHSNDTVFQVKLNGISKFNCKHSITKAITVYSYINADFTINEYEGCSPLTITLSNASIGGVVQDTWNYGDGTFESMKPKSFTHTYTNTLNRSLTRPLRLIVRNSRSCTDTATHSVMIHPNVNAQFTTFNNITQGCNTLKINFIDQSNPLPVPFEWNWDFGDGASSLDKNPQHVFENLGNTEKLYRTRLYVYSEHRCSDTAELNIRVYPFIKADFTFNEPVGCSPHTITINNGTSAAVNKYYWTFGDGTTGTNNIPSFPHTYRNLTPNSIVYQSKLMVAYNNGNGRGDMCKDSITRTVEVYPEVTAAFTEDTLKGCHPLTVNFKNTSLLGLTSAPSGSLKYDWTFGDKAGSILTDQKHTYYNYSNVDSFYNVKLKATSLYKCTNSVTKIVTIYPKPKALMEADNLISCPPFKINVTNTSEAADIYHWTFEPGSTLNTTNLNPVSHTYYNNNSPDIIDYDLKLSAESVHNCWDSTSQVIRVRPRVFAGFDPDTAGCSPLLVSFRNTTRQASKYWWNLGDGTTTKLTSPSHPYFNSSVKDSTFRITLVGESLYGCKDTVYRSVTVYPQPQAEFAMSKYYLEYPDNIVNFYNRSSAGNWQYLWDFQNGIQSTLKDPGMQEYSWGQFNITLQTSSIHCKDSVSHLLTIRPPRPIPDFIKSADGCVPLEVSFKDTSKYTKNWFWDFNDGTRASGPVQQHTFNEAGSYKIKLTVVGFGNDTAYTFKEVVAFPKPIVDFKVKPELAMLSEKKEALVKFYNTSKLGTTYVWEFGDSAKSKEYEPVHVYNNVGSYTITLRAWTDKGCYDLNVKPDLVKIVGEGVCIFPNAFTPNINSPGDGSYPEKDTNNDVFHPYWKGVVEYHLEVYDRWGEKLFESDDVNKGWNGWYKGKLCKTDVYIWKAKGKFTDGTTFEKAGNVTLLR